MTRRRPALAFVAIGALLAASCASDRLASREEKIASFVPYAEATIDGRPIADFLSDRVGLLFAGDQVTFGRGPDGELRVDYPEGVPVRLDIGAAAAVAPDGYFLTAAHCVKEGQRLLFKSVAPDGAPQMEALAPRVVWMGDPDSDDLDIALLKVDAPPRACFAWADIERLAPSSPVICVGSDFPTMRAAAGRIRDPIEPLREHGPADAATTLVSHDAPMWRGDSGGPLCTLQGELIGITALAVRPFLAVGRPRGVAIHPLPAWVKWMIEQDRRGG